MASASTNETGTSPRRSAFGALRHRDFRLLWLGSCVSLVGSWVQIVTMGWLVYQMTGSKQALGVIGLMGGLPTTALMLFGGVLADRANKRALVLCTQSLFALTAFTLAVLTWTDLIRIWHIVALSFVNGVVFAVDGPARQAMVYDIVGEDDLAAGVALQSAAFNVARIIGPLVGSLIYAALGPGWCFFTNGVSFAAILGAILFIRTDLTRRGDAQGSVWVGFVEGLRYLRSNPLMRSVVSLTAMTSLFAFSAYGTLMPALARDRLRITEDRYGLLFSAIGVGALIGAFLVGRHAAEGRRGLLMIVGAHLFALALLGLAWATHLYVAMGLLLVIGMAAISELATANTLTQSLAPEGMRGRAVSTHMFAMAGLQPFGAFLAGSLAQRWGVPGALTVGGAVLLAFALGLAVLRPQIVRLK